MQLSFELILEELHMEPERHLKENPYFSSVELYILGSSDNSGKSLLVSTLSEALMVPKRKGVFFLCTRDRIVDDTETDESMRGICVVKRNMDIKELFNAVQRVFSRIKDWEMAMNRSVMEGKGVQELLDMSENIIGNHIAVMDASFKLLGATYGIKTDDEVSTMLTENGYHVAETVEKLKEARRIQEYATADEEGIIISDDHKISKYTSVKKVYRYERSFFAIVVMICCNKPCTPGLLHLYEILLDHIGYYLRVSHPAISGKKPDDSLICELIEGRIENSKEAAERAYSLGVEFEGYFLLFVIEIDDSQNTPISRIALELQHQLRGSQILVYNNEALVLSSHNEVTDCESIGHIIDDILVPGANCGSSNHFTSLWELPIAYEQSKEAMALGKRIERKAGTGKSRFKFNDYYLYYMVSHCMKTKPEIFSKSLPGQWIKTLKDYDEGHKAKTIELLGIYLKCGGSATETSAAAHIHRNTVLYHVSRIEGILNISLEDTAVRVGLMLALMADEITY